MPTPHLSPPATDKARCRPLPSTPRGPAYPQTGSWLRVGTVGNCLTRYRCSTCGGTFDVDSGD